MSSVHDHQNQPMDGAAAPSTALRLDDVTLELGDGSEKIRALDHIDLQVAAGELVAIIGPSGAGESSLLPVAGVLASPTSGTVQVQGTDVATCAVRASWLTSSAVTSVSCSSQATSSRADCG